jgi:DNA-binding cell septation regulator SpoVG
VIHDIRFTPGTDQDAERGLLAFVRMCYGPLIVDGVTLRRTRAGTLALSWPSRTDRSGARHALVRPLNDSAREELEAAVFAELRRQEAGQ